MASDKEIIIGSDHAGYNLKEFVKKELGEQGYDVTDAGAEILDPSDDYPVFAREVARNVSEGIFSRGIAICGTGIGASMAANRFKNVRAALCIKPDMARMARAHNDANVLAMGERIVPPATASQIVKAFLETPFDGGRHQRRIEMIDC